MGRWPAGMDRGMDQMWTETPLLPGGWELVSRIAMTVGTAGLLGVLGRCVAVWLRERDKADPP